MSGFQYNLNVPSTALEGLLDELSALLYHKEIVLYLKHHNDAFHRAISQHLFMISFCNLTITFRSVNTLFHHSYYPQ